MEKDDAAGLDFREYTLLYLGGGNALPVETVPIDKDLKPLSRKGLRVLPFRAPPATILKNDREA